MEGYNMRKGYAAVLLLPIVCLVQAETDLDLIYGQPVTSQNLNIHHADARIFTDLTTFSSWKCNFGVGLRAGYMSVGSGSAARLGAEGMLWCPLTDKWRISVPVGMVWLSDHEFGEPGRRKDFGGPFQFVAALSLDFQFDSRWALGYALSHMSNWNQYESNPSLNSHNIVVRYSFN